MLDVRFQYPNLPDNREEFLLLSGSQILSVDTNPIDAQVNAHLFELDKADPDDLKYIANIYLNREVAISFMTPKGIRTVRGDALYVVGHSAVTLSGDCYLGEKLTRLDMLDLFTANQIKAKWEQVQERIQHHRQTRK